MSTLTEKVGPLPVWAWGIGAGVTIAGVSAIVRRRKGTPTPADTDDTAPTSGTLADGAGGEAFLAAGTYVPPSSTGSTGTGGLNITSNGQWVDRAAALVSAMTHLGLPSVDKVRSALARWLASEPVTSTESVWINAAQSVLGAPPEGGPSSPNVVPDTNPTPTPAPPPVTCRAGYNAARRPDGSGWYCVPGPGAPADARPYDPVTGAEVGAGAATPPPLPPGLGP